VVCSLCREDGSVVYNYYWCSPAQLFSGPIFFRLTTTFYCLRCETSPNLEGQIPVFIFPRNRVTKLCPQALGFSHPFSAEFWLYLLGSRESRHLLEEFCFVSEVIVYLSMSCHGNTSSSAVTYMPG
jgi:hypothetical protein